MRVVRLGSPGGIKSLILTRGLRERQKETLALGIALGLFVGRFALRKQGAHEPSISDAHAAIVGSTFGHREGVGRRPLVRIIRLGHRVVELRYLAARRFGKFLAILRALPVARITVLVEFR